MHHGEVPYANYVGTGYPDINYEIEVECCGKKNTFFVDDGDAMDSDL